MIIEILVIALWAATFSGALLSLTLLPLARVIGYAKTSFSKLLFKFLISVASLQVLNVFSPLILLASYYGWINSPDIVGWLYIVATGLLVIENIIVGWFAIWMYKKLRGSDDER
jgi:hypothetical protein